MRACVCVLLHASACVCVRVLAKVHASLKHARKDEACICMFEFHCQKISEKRDTHTHTSSRNRHGAVLRSEIRALLGFLTHQLDLVACILASHRNQEHPLGSHGGASAVWAVSTAKSDYCLLGPSLSHALLGLPLTKIR